ncbi:MAG: hypothetical protein IIA07_09460 [Proteobacteria bacterium]|nr:hypothetical protein [Pseudomonadota bacterium]
MPRSLLLPILLWCGIALADDATLELGGHAKLRLIAQSFADESLFRDLAGATSTDFEGELRINFSANPGHWSFDSAWQLFALNGDSVEWTRGLGPAADLLIDRLPNDERRLFDLTDVIRDEGRNAVVHRLDRFSVAYTGEKVVARFGRQALSWGNGLFYSPMDLVNPFDPTAIDIEFKTGDDMIYLQYLRDSGDDVQGAVVIRRNPVTGNVDSDEGTVALKYHAFAGGNEYDILIAESYGDTVIGIGGVFSIGGAVLRGDVVATDAANGTRVQVVTNLGYSWTWGGRNVSGVLEVYFNGFGQHGGEYDPASLATNPELLERLARREVFALGRYYIAGSLSIEMSPLWTMTPTVLANVGDPSGLLQFVTQYSVSDDITFLGSLNVPLGANGSEFGGIETGIAGQYLSTDASVFAQLAWYF